MVKKINACKRKTDLQALLTQYGVEFTTSQTMDVLKSKIYRHLMELEVPPSGKESMGFGKHCEMTFEQVAVEKPEYTKWCVNTAVENPESYWRLLRFAQWAQGMSKTEKETIRLRLGSPWTEGYPAKAAMPKRAVAHSGASGSENSWELAQEMSHDLEMVPDQAMNRIKELEEELLRLRQEMTNRENLNHRTSESKQSKGPSPP